MEFNLLLLLLAESHDDKLFDRLLIWFDIYILLMMMQQPYPFVSNPLLDHHANIEAVDKVSQNISIALTYCIPSYFVLFYISCRYHCDRFNRHMPILL